MPARAFCCQSQNVSVFSHKRLKGWDFPNPSIRSQHGFTMFSLSPLLPDLTIRLISTHQPVLSFPVIFHYFTPLISSHFPHKSNLSPKLILLSRDTFPATRGVGRRDMYNVYLCSMYGYSLSPNILTFIIQKLIFTWEYSFYDTYLFY